MQEYTYEYTGQTNYSAISIYPTSRDHLKMKMVQYIQQQKYKQCGS